MNDLLDFPKLRTVELGTSAFSGVQNFSIHGMLPNVLCNHTL